LKPSFDRNQHLDTAKEWAGYAGSHDVGFFKAQQPADTTVEEMETTEAFGFLQILPIQQLITRTARGAMRRRDFCTAGNGGLRTWVVDPCCRDTGIVLRTNQSIMRETTPEAPGGIRHDGSQRIAPAPHMLQGFYIIPRPCSESVQTQSLSGSFWYDHYRHYRGKLSKGGHSSILPAILYSHQLLTL
jgi:hypothetical protein